MRLSAILARDRRLMGIVLLSLLLHLLALRAITLPSGAPAPAAAPLAVRLMPAPAVPAIAAMPPAPQPGPVAAPAPAPAPPPIAFVPLRPTESGVPNDAPPQAMPTQYRVTPAPPARIDYRITSGHPGAPLRDDGAAHLTWRTDGSTYRIDVDGVLGELASEGGLDDSGIAPTRLHERVGAGSVTTDFDRVNDAIDSRLGVRRDQLAGGSQDRASLLVQLAGMGMANPDQLRGVLEFWVGASGGARLERYEVREMATIDTGAGALEALHLVQLVAQDAPQLELWLAPNHAWLPVQLRVTQPGGQVRTQTLAAIEIEARP